MSTTSPSRRAFTENLTTQPLPDNANEEWTQFTTNLKSLLEALSQHDAMKENIDRPYNEPAKHKNKVYFMWDYIGRTLGMAFSADSSDPKKSPFWTEARQRAVMGGMMIKGSHLDLDTICPSDRGEKIEFGEDIIKLADELAN
jgi:hypothetical protein